MARYMAPLSIYIYPSSRASCRAITLYFLRNHTDWTDPAEVSGALKDIIIEFEFNIKSQQSEILLNGENVEYLIRDLVIAEKVSEIAAIAAVRTFAVAQQKQMGEKKGIIMDGRDIGTTVFPEAELKIFMTADSAVRVERRFREMYAKNPNIIIEEVKANLELRDYIDSNREVSPLRKAEDAVELDNTHLSIAEQLSFALNLANERINK